MEEDGKKSKPTPTTLRNNGGNPSPKQLSGSLNTLDIHNSNMPITWKNWFTQLKIYLRANNLENEADSRKVAILLHFIGTEALTIFYSFNVNIDTVTFKELTDAFNRYFTPQINITMERHTLFNRRQGQDETIDDYATDLKNIGRQCEFSTLEDSLLRDVFSWNLHSRNHYIKESILMKKPTTLSEAIELARTIETTKIQAKTLEDATTFIGRVQAESRPPCSSSRKSRTPSSSRLQRPRSSSRQDTCSRCGQVHRVRCPAKGVKCNKCGKYNHFAIVCRNTASSSTQVHQILVNPEESNSLHLASIYVNNITSDSWKASLIINNVNVCFLLDSGADTNILSINTFNKLRLPPDMLTKSRHKLSTYSGDTIPTVGQCTLPVCHDNKTYNVTFHVVDVNAQEILGRDSCKTMKLIKRIHKVTINTCDSILSSYKDLFQGLGLLKDFTCDLKLKPDVTPTIDYCRRVPFQVKKQLKVELDDLEKTGIICRVDEPTEWVSSLVLTTKKNGKLRLCIDPRKLNKAIMRSHYQFPTMDEIKSDLAGAKFFTTLDANKGFWMLPLSDASSRLCTFISPFGRFRFTRLPYGINAAPEIFHREMVKRFNDIDNVKIMMDDFLIYGKTLEEHNETLQKVLDRAREINIKFNKEKCVVCVPQVKYLGHIFSQDGVQVDPAKVKAICDMPRPTCTNDLQRFMGMVNYLSPFIPNLSKENSLLRTLLSKQTEWSWSDQHETELNNIKILISSAPVLTYYDPNKDNTMSVDASKDALGCVLLQEKQPIAYASASLTKCQQNYSQIEKEAMAILFACSKFHQYIYGRTFTVETDHKPLITLFKKALNDVPARLQRIMLRLQPYELNVIYKPGRYLYIADTLSRAALKESALQDLEKDIDLHVNNIMSNLSVSPEKLEEIKQATCKDTILSQIIKYCQVGWPEHKRSVGQSIKPYFSLKDKLSEIDNILFMSDKIVIPESFREYVLKLVHVGHQGINSCIRLAKSTVYWPNISNDIEKFVNQCHTCMTYRRCNSKEPILHHEYKLLPWNKVGIDMFEFNNEKYLIVVDYFSKYVELALLNSGTNANKIITHLKSIFARHGIPEFIVSDNGPPFSSVEFQAFAKDWHIKHITSSPYLSRSNGLVERTIGTIKHMFKKCKADNNDPYLSLLLYRNTPKKTGYSPAQILMSRNLRTKIPVTDSQLSPTSVNYDHVKEQIEKHKSYSTIYYNKHAKSLPKVHKGDKVYFKHKPQGVWIPGTISDTSSEPRSFIIQSPQGEFRRSRQHIHKPVTPMPEMVPENKENISVNDNVNRNDNASVPSTGIVTNNSTRVTTRSGREVRKPARYY